MRKLAFYPRLAASNLWRNRRTYIPYLLACIVSIFTFYTMLAINTNGALDGMRGETIVKSFTAIGTFILAIFCSILVFYTNSFLIKRRKKELGLYSILGMEKKNIAILMLFETLFVAVAALAAGLSLGVLLGQLLFWTLLRMIQFPVMMAMPISPAAIGITLALFGVVFLLALLSNLRQVHIANPINLMRGGKEGEKEPKASWLLTGIGLVCLVAGYAIAIYVQSPIEAVMMFLLTVALVIIGTYCLFTSGSIALLKLLRRNKKYYYQPGHFISVSGMIYRMKQNATGLATICILSCMVLVTVSTTVSLNVGVEDALGVQYPYEYDLRLNAPEDGSVLLAGAEDIARQTGVTLVDVQDYSRVGFMANEQDGMISTGGYQDGVLLNDYVQMLVLDEYNRNEGKQETLGPGEALLLVTGGDYRRDALAIEDERYATRKLETLGRDTWGSRDVGRIFTLVLPDEAARDAALQASQSGAKVLRRIAFDLAGEDGAKEQFMQAYNAYIDGLRTQEKFTLSLREEGREDWYASNGGFLFLGIYFGVLFMLAAALIIYYKQLSEGYDDAERFDILQKVGMGESEVKRTINKQILVVFFLPLLVAILHVAVAFFPISRAMVLFGILNIPLLAVTCLLTIAAYTVVYLLVFRQTARTYFGIVRRQSAST